MVVNDQFTCQECRKVQITERIFPKELENLFKLEKFSNYGDSNYGKKIIVSLGNFMVTLNLFELQRSLTHRDSNQKESTVGQSYNFCII